MKVAFITSEAVPYAKTGGLADVSGILPVELKKMGHEVIMVLPYYKVIRDKGIPATKIRENVYVTEGAGGLTVYLIAGEKYFDRSCLYGTPKGDYPDNALRFGFFCRETLKLLPEINFRPDIIHTNDWQTGLIPLFLKTTERGNPFFKETRTVFTIHNMAYLGLFRPDVIPELGLPGDVFNPLSGIEFYGKVSFLKAGLIGADAISTVSRKYSEEIQTKEYGCGLDGLLKARTDHLYGILNGVDYQHWNPETDNYIAQKYSIDDMGGKKKCRDDLLQEFGVEISDKIPVIGMISRLADQKGFDILAKGLKALSNMDLFIVLLGTGDEKYHKLFGRAKKRYPRHFGVRIDFDNILAHKIEAGSDMFLMPSRYEPCGLNQIYSLKYGTVPIVRATGGLDDTISNFDREAGQGNGFKFTAYNSRQLVKVINSAIEMFQDKKIWQVLVRNGMGEDFSWHRSAEKYVQMYRDISAVGG